MDVGHYLSTFYNDLVQPGVKFVDVFRVLHPGLAFRYEIIQTFKNMHFVFEIRLTRSGCQQQLRLKGQMIQLKHNNVMLFICSPKVGNLEQMRNSQLFISDIPLHDCTRDLVLLNQQRQTEIELRYVAVSLVAKWLTAIKDPIFLNIGSLIASLIII